MSTGVRQVLALEPDVSTAEFFSQALCKVQRRGTTDEVVIGLDLLLEINIRFQFGVSGLEFFEGCYECLRCIATTELTKFGRECQSLNFCKENTQLALTHKNFVEQRTAFGFVSLRGSLLFRCGLDRGTKVRCNFFGNVGASTNFRLADLLSQHGAYDNTFA